MNETVRKIIENLKNYSVNVSVDYWQECNKRCDFYAYPVVKISLINSTLVVFVDLGTEKVVRIITK